MIQVQKVKWCMKHLKISYSTHAYLAQLDQHQTCKPVMVSVVSSNPTGGNFIFKDTSMLILYKNDRDVRFVLFTKTSNKTLCDDNNDKYNNNCNTILGMMIIATCL